MSLSLLHQSQRAAQCDCPPRASMDPHLFEFDFCTLRGQATVFSSSCLIFRDPGPRRASDKIFCRILCLLSVVSMSAKDGSDFDCVPRTIERLINTMAFPREPQHDQRVEQHRQWCRPFDCFARPALRLFKAQVLLAVMKSHFDTPATGVPGNHLLGGGRVTRRIKRLPISSASERFGRDDPQWPCRCGMNPCLAVNQPGLFRPPVNIEHHTPTTSGKHFSGVGKRLPRLRGRPLVPGLRIGGASYSRASMSNRLVRSQFSGK